MTDTIREFIIQGFGFIGIALLCFSFARKNMKNALKFKLIADIVWGLHFGFLGAFAGMVANIVCAVREISFLTSKKSRKWLLIIFVMINFIVAYFRWEGIKSILPAIASALATYSFWQKNMTVTRVIGLINNAIYFTYDVFVGSYLGMLSELTVATSIIVTFIVKKVKKA